MKIETEDGVIEINRAVRCWRVFRTGLADGWNQPFDLTSGMTYEGAFWNNLYDWGANFGQWFGTIFNRNS